jgi:hypothetical protein
MIRWFVAAGAILVLLVALLLYHPYRSSGEVTPLMIASMEGNAVAARKEIENGADVNQTRGTKWTCCQMIVLYSENAGYIYGRNQSALLFAVQSGSESTVEALLKAGAVPLPWPEDPSDSPWSELVRPGMPENAEMIGLLVRYTENPPKEVVWLALKYAVERADRITANRMLSHLGSKTESIDSPTVAPTATLAIAETEQKLALWNERMSNEAMPSKEYWDGRARILAEF